MVGKFVLGVFIYLLGGSVAGLLLGLIILIRGRALLLSWDIIVNYGIEVGVIVLFDWLSVIFLSFVLMISSIVIFYRNEYITGDNNYKRFFYLIVGFVISMVIIIISPNLIIIMLGWDGLGLVSYCLIIYYQRMRSYVSGIITVLMNRVGDVCILGGIGLILEFGGWGFVRVEFLQGNKVLVFLVLIAAITRRAQIPFRA